AHRRRDRDGNRLHESMRLSRSRTDLDGREGYRPRHGSLQARLRVADAAEELSSEAALNHPSPGAGWGSTTGRTREPFSPRQPAPAANWSYPTSIRFGAGRIKELAKACESAGMKAPPLVTDPFLATQPMTRDALASLSAAGLRAAIFSDVKP